MEEHDMSNNNSNFRLTIFLNGDSSGNFRPAAGSSVAFRKEHNREKISSSAATSGEICFYITGSEDSDDTEEMDILRRAAIVKPLRQRNNLITEIKLLLELPWYEEDIDLTGEIGSYIMGVCNFGRCTRLNVNNGHFTNVQAGILFAANDDLLVGNHNIRHLQFENCRIGKNMLTHISEKYSQLDTIEFNNCYSGNNSPYQLPFVTELKLPNTRIDRLCLSDSGHQQGGRRVFYSSDQNAIVLISVVSVNQEFARGYNCTSIARESMVGEINKGLLDAVCNVAEPESVALVKIETQRINSLSLKVFGGRHGKSLLFDINLSFPSEA